MAWAKGKRALNTVIDGGADDARQAEGYDWLAKACRAGGGDSVG